MDSRTSENGMDAATGRGRSRLGGFLRGVLLALVLCAAAAVAVSLTTPPPGDLPVPGQIEAAGTPPAAGEAQVAGEPFSAGPETAAGTSPNAATGTPPVASPEQMAEGEPFSAGPDGLPDEESGPSAPDAATDDEAARAAQSAGIAAPEGTAATPADEPVSAGTGEQSAGVPAPQNGTTQDGATQDGATQDGATQDGATQDGATQDGATSGGSTPGGSTPGGATGDAPDSALSPGPETAEGAPDLAAATPQEEPSVLSEAAGSAGAEEDPPAAAAGSENAPATAETENAPAGMAGTEEAPAVALGTESAPAAASETGDALAAAPAAEEAAPAGSGALAANARAFDAPRQAPLMAVVLVGEDVGALTPERLSLLTMPLTVAIPPGLADAAEIGAAARAAGHEVLASLSLAGDAAPGLDAELAALDMAVGATAADDARAAGAEVLGPVLEDLDRQGLAWVDTGAGIGTPAERIARELGMPYTQGNRAIDGESDPDELYRAIDSAARQARQWGSSVLFLDAGEPALQVLVRWGLEQSGDNPVWFAPVSAVIERRSRP